jgi:putative transposase
MRKRLRLPDYDYGLEGAYGVTVCTHRRRSLLHGPTAALVEAELCLLQDRYRVVLDYHVVMGDHVHAILFLPPGSRSLSAVVGGFKSLSTVAIYRQGLASGQIWQRGFYDRVIRDEKELQRLRQYIQENPKAEALANGMFEKYQTDLEAEHGTDP